MMWMKGGQRMSAARLGRVGRIVAGLGAVATAFQVAALLTASVSPRQPSMATGSGPTVDSTARRLFEAFDDLLSNSGSSRHRASVSVTPTPQVAAAPDLRRADEAVAQ